MAAAMGMIGTDWGYQKGPTSFLIIDHCKRSPPVTDVYWRPPLVNDHFLGMILGIYLLHLLAIVDHGLSEMIFKQ
jgi:hypothetical protein